MRLIGLVGGVASGKSAVAECFRQLGAEILDADRLGHAVLRQEGVKHQLVARWGAKILDASGEISRPAVASIVFGSADLEERKFLEALTHPLIAEEVARQIALLRQKQIPAAILDAALLFEAGWDQQCDFILFVSLPRELRLKRAQNRGWTEADLLARESNQLPLDEKRQRCGFVIDNSGPSVDTFRQVAEFWRLNIAPTDH